MFHLLNSLKAPKIWKNVTFFKCESRSYVSRMVLALKNSLQTKYWRCCKAHQVDHSTRVKKAHSSGHVAHYPGSPEVPDPGHPRLNGLVQVTCSGHIPRASCSEWRCTSYLFNTFQWSGSCCHIRKIEISNNNSCWKPMITHNVTRHHWLLGSPWSHIMLQNTQLIDGKPMIIHNVTKHHWLLGSWYLPSTTRTPAYGPQLHSVSQVFSAWGDRTTPLKRPLTEWLGFGGLHQENVAGDEHLPLWTARLLMSFRYCKLWIF